MHIVCDDFNGFTLVAILIGVRTGLDRSPAQLSAGLCGILAHKVRCIAPCYYIDKISLPVSACFHIGAVYRNSETVTETSLAVCLNSGSATRRPIKTATLSIHSLSFRFLQQFCSVFLFHDQRTKNTIGDLVNSVELSGKGRSAGEADQSIIPFGFLVNLISESTLTPFINSVYRSVRSDQSFELFDQCSDSSSPNFMERMNTVS